MTFLVSRDSPEVLAIGKLSSLPFSRSVLRALIIMPPRAFRTRPSGTRVGRNLFSLPRDNPLRATRLNVFK